MGMNIGARSVGRGALYGLAPQADARRSNTSSAHIIRGLDPGGVMIAASGFPHRTRTTGSGKSGTGERKPSDCNTHRASLRQHQRNREALLGRHPDELDEALRNQTQETTEKPSIPAPTGSATELLLNLSNPDPSTPGQHMSHRTKDQAHDGPYPNSEIICAPQAESGCRDLRVSPEL